MANIDIPPGGFPLLKAVPFPSVTEHQLSIDTAVTGKASTPVTTGTTSMGSLFNVSGSTTTTRADKSTPASSKAPSVRSTPQPDKTKVVPGHPKSRFFIPEKNHPDRQAYLDRSLRRLHQPNHVKRSYANSRHITLTKREDDMHRWVLTDLYFTVGIRDYNSYVYELSENNLEWLCWNMVQLSIKRAIEYKDLPADTSQTDKERVGEVICRKLIKAIENRKMLPENMLMPM